MENYIEHSIKIIRKAEEFSHKYYGKPLFVAFSGGKDSQCIYELCRMAGVDFKAYFSPTTIDPPQVLKFIREHYPDVEWHKPKESIYTIAERKMLPTMKVRWCCSEFKENKGQNDVVITGVRKAESSKRAKRTEFEKTTSNKNNRKSWSYEQFAGNEETINHCLGNGNQKLVVSPIIEWRDSQVWHFLNDVAKVPHCSLYDNGHHRIGCILCPMSSYKQKVRDCEKFPYVKQKWLETFAKTKQTRHEANWAYEPEQIFDWWIRGDSLKKWESDNFQQQKIDFK